MCLLYYTEVGIYTGQNFGRDRGRTRPTSGAPGVSAEEVGHDHMHIKSGRVAPCITLYKNLSHDLKPSDSFKRESMLKSRKEDLVPYPACPPLQFFENLENAILHKADQNYVFIDCDGFLSLL